MRTAVCVLLAIAATALCPTATGCRSHNASEGGDSRNGVDWQFFTPLPSEETEVDAGLTLDELHARVGFPIVLPTYLPNGISNRYFRDGIGQSTGAPSLEAEIFLLPMWGSGAPFIFIGESVAEPGHREKQCAPDDCEIVQIGETAVECRVIILDPWAALNVPRPPTSTPPELRPRLRCEWENGQLSFIAEFLWRLTEPVPGYLPPEMREEAMKAVASMIEDPYIVGAGD